MIIISSVNETSFVYYMTHSLQYVSINRNRRTFYPDSYIYSCEGRRNGHLNFQAFALCSLFLHLLPRQADILERGAPPEKKRVAKQTPCNPVTPFHSHDHHEDFLRFSLLLNLF